MKYKKYVKVKQIREYSNEKEGYTVFRLEQLLETLEELQRVDSKQFSYRVTKLCYDGEEINFIFIMRNKKIMNYILNSLTKLYYDKYEINFECKRWEVL